MKKSLICLLALALTCSRVSASPGPDRQHIEAVKKKVTRCVDRPRSVVVETFDGRRFEGAIIEAGSEDFLLVYGGRETNLSYGEVKKIKWQSPVWKHAQAAAIAAAITAAIFGWAVLLGGPKG